MAIVLHGDSVTWRGGYTMKLLHDEGVNRFWNSSKTHKKRKHRSLQETRYPFFVGGGYI